MAAQGLEVLTADKLFQLIWAPRVDGAFVERSAPVIRGNTSMAVHMGMLEVKGQVYGQFSGREFGSKV
jgi:hypothetical protein